MLNRRRDNTATVGNRGIKPELIATANIPNFDAAEYFRNHPQQQFLGTPEETMAWEQRFGEAFNPDDYRESRVFSGRHRPTDHYSQVNCQ